MFQTIFFCTFIEVTWDHSYCHWDLKTEYFEETDFSQNIDNGWKADSTKKAIEKRKTETNIDDLQVFYISSKVAVSNYKKIL